MKEQPQNVVSISGGKDSTALALLAIEKETQNLHFVFADTGHEAQTTYDYVDYLGEEFRKRCGVGITWVRGNFSHDIERKREFIKAHWKKDLMSGKPGRWILRKKLKPGEERPQEPPPPADHYQPAQTDFFRWEIAYYPLPESEAEVRVARALEVLKPTGIPFLDLCLWKGRFPSTRVRFCSEELKHKPMMQQVQLPLAEQHKAVISWQGVRRDESHERKDLLEKDLEFGAWDPEPSGLLIYRPILDWKAEDCFEMHRKHGVKWNPLYEQGMTRVGCMPCIHCNKNEMRQVTARFPDELARVQEWEKIVSDASKRGCSTFMDARITAAYLGTGTTIYDIDAESHGIQTYAAWSKTARGGRQQDLIHAIEEQDDHKQCTSIYGLCE